MASIDPVLTFVALLGACVWIGGFAAIVVLVRAARRQLDPDTQVAFFRAFGRGYLPVGCAGLVLALGAGAVLLAGRDWDGLALAAVLVAAALVLSLAAGVFQARGMTLLRSRLLALPDDPQLNARVARGALRAALLRATIGLLSLVLLALASALATTGLH